MFIGNNWITDKDKCTNRTDYKTREQRAQDRKHTKNRQQGNNTMRTSK